MSFDGPDQILPVFHHLMTFEGPKNLMSFDGPKSRFSPFKISCLLQLNYDGVNIYLRTIKIKCISSSH